jgi:hypothetical protein
MESRLALPQTCTPLRLVTELQLDHLQLLTNVVHQAAANVETALSPAAAPT